MEKPIRKKLPSLRATHKYAQQISNAIKFFLLLLGVKIDWNIPSQNLIDNSKVGIFSARWRRTRVRNSKHQFQGRSLNICPGSSSYPFQSQWQKPFLWHLDFYHHFQRSFFISPSILSPWPELRGCQGLCWSHCIPNAARAPWRIFAVKWVPHLSLLLPPSLILELFVLEIP